MSFASKPKSLQSTLRSPLTPRTPRTVATPKPFDRLGLLEKSVMKLKRQQDSLAAVVALVDRIDEFTLAESEQKSLQFRMSALDERAAELAQIGEETDLQTPEPQCAYEDEFRDVKKFVTGVEVLHQSVSLKHKLELKGSEIAVKEAILEMVKRCERGIESARTELEAAMKDIEKKEKREIGESREEIEIMRGRFAKERDGLTSLIMESILTHPDISKSTLESEFLSLLTTALSDLRTLLTYRIEQFDLFFKQELAVLQNELEVLKVHAVPIRVDQSMRPMHIAEVYGETGESIETLEKQCENSLSALSTVIPIVKANIDTLKARLNTYIPASATPDLNSELEEMLNSGLFQIEFLVSNVKTVESRGTEELKRMAEGVEPLEAEKKRINQDAAYEDLIWLENLIPRLTQAQATLPRQVSQLKDELKQLASDLYTVWTTAFVDKGLDVPIPDSSVWEDEWEPQKSEDLSEEES